MNLFGVCVFIYLFSSSHTPSLCNSLVIMFSSMFSDDPKSLFKKATKAIFKILTFDSWPRNKAAS